MDGSESEIGGDDEISLCIWPLATTMKVLSMLPTTRIKSKQK
jgi:hypothetical protein